MHLIDVFLGFDAWLPPISKIARQPIDRSSGIILHLSYCEFLLHRHNHREAPTFMKNMVTVWWKVVTERLLDPQQKDLGRDTRCHRRVQSLTMGESEMVAWRRVKSRIT